MRRTFDAASPNIDTRDYQFTHTHPALIIIYINCSQRKCAGRTIDALGCAASSAAEMCVYAYGHLFGEWVDVCVFGVKVADKCGCCCCHNAAYCSSACTRVMHLSAARSCSWPPKHQRQRSRDHRIHTLPMAYMRVLEWMLRVCLGEMAFKWIHHAQRAYIHHITAQAIDRHPKRNKKESSRTFTLKTRAAYYVFACAWWHWSHTQTRTK